MSELIANKFGELIGHVGSPSTTNEIKVNLEEYAYSKGLVGHFCIIPFVQDGKNHFSIGQIVSVQLRNPYLERHSVEKIIAVRGEASPLTKEHDVINVILGPSSTYSVDEDRITPSTMATVPSTGTPVYSLSQEIVNAISRSCGASIVYLGKMYNTNILLPMTFQHFGAKEEGGLGEGYHIGVFGKTGSGKSVLTRMIILSYARFPNMSILCLDPTGEYAKEIKQKEVMFKILKNILNRSFQVYGVSEISLTSTNSLRRILLASAPDFLDFMGIRAEENRINAANLIAEFFEANREIPLPTGQRIPSLPNASEEFVFNQLLDYISGHINRIYVSQDAQNRVLSIINNRTQRRLLFQRWRSLALLFDSRRISIDKILSSICQKREIVIIDLSETSAEGVYWNERVRAIVIDEILNSLVNIAETTWRESDRSVNALVVIDEAHRLAPRERSEIEELEKLKHTFIDSVRTTRKYGLGWMFVSQSLASLHLEILRQMRIYFFGYGLSWGSERYNLEELVGRGPQLELYSNFKDPQTSAILGKKEYPFMVYGPVSPLSISGNPIFFTALDYYTEFEKVNFKKSEGEHHD